MARIKDMYKAEVAPALMKKFEYKSPMQIPKLDKIVINCGVGEAKENSKALDAVLKDLEKIDLILGLIVALMRERERDPRVNLGQRTAIPFQFLNISHKTSLISNGEPLCRSRRSPEAWTH